MHTDYTKYPIGYAKLQAQIIGAEKFKLIKNPYISETILRCLIDIGYDFVRFIPGDGDPFEALKIYGREPSKIVLTTFKTVLGIYITNMARAKIKMVGDLPEKLQIDRYAVSLGVEKLADKLVMNDTVVEFMASINKWGK